MHSNTHTQHAVREGEESSRTNLPQERRCLLQYKKRLLLSKDGKLTLVTQLCRQLIVQLGYQSKNRIQYKYWTRQKGARTARIRPIKQNKIQVNSHHVPKWQMHTFKCIQIYFTSEIKVWYMARKQTWTQGQRYRIQLTQRAWCRGKHEQTDENKMNRSTL